MITKTIIENVLILIGESFWVFSAYAQLHRISRSRNRLGLSAISETLTAAGNVAWATYFASRHLWFPFVTNLIILVIVIAILGYVLSNKKQFYRGLAAIIIVGPLTSLLLIKFPHIGGWLGVAYNNIASTPQLAHILKVRKTSGISVRALGFAYGAMACTFTYAILIVSYPLIVGCLLGVVYNTVITRYYFRYRHHN